MRSSLLTALALLFGASTAFADPGDPPQVTYGPSAGYLRSAGPTLGLDATWIPSTTDVSWLSAGVRGAHPDGRALVIPYVEAGYYLLLNVGVGVSTPLGAGHGASVLVHLFLGLPFGKAENDAFYVEPYYRPAYGGLLGQTGFHHELGLLVKWGYIQHRSVVLF